MTNRNPFSRRHFLLGAGSTALAIPLLPSLMREAHAATGAPKRFIAIISPYGHNPTSFFPGGQTGKINIVADQRVNDHTYYKRLSEISGRMSAVFDSRFDPWRNQMNILLGLDGIGLEGHPTVGSLTASVRADASDDRGTPPADLARSIDCIMGNSSAVYSGVSPKTKVLRVSDFDYRGAWGASWDRAANGSAVRVPYMEGDRKIFDFLFNGVSSGSTDNSAARAEAQGHKTVVDKVMDRYKRIVANPRLSAIDRQRLDQHVNLVHETQTRILASLSNSGGACQVPSLKYNGDAGRENYWKNVIDTTIGAFSCDLTRVACFYMNAFRNGNDQNDSTAHDNSHDRQGGGTGEATANAYSSFKSEQVLHLLKRLSETPEIGGTGTMLDNTLVLLTGDQGHGGWHMAQSLPIATFGGLGGAVKTGFLVDFRMRPLRWWAGRQDFVCALGQPYNRFLVSVMRAMGIPDSEFIKYGDSGGYGSWRESNFTDGHYGQFRSTRNQTMPVIFTG